WDPFYFKENELSNFKSNSFQTILCTYVLNVIHKNERIDAIKNIKKLLHKEGVVFFTVRTTQDILDKAKNNSWKKNLDGWITQKKTFQKGFTSEELESLIRDNGFRNVKTVSKNPLIVQASETE
ncbi:MAG: methyltransferase domain-containing protein, partial [Nitrosopumilaceae archaeon]|nr:methyltransferase domain-containing protein [Nitrosopumilaceae archaeon]